MSDDNEYGPKRFESELTVIIDRSRLPPPSGTIEMLDEIERLRREAQDRTTQMECPLCRMGLVTPEQHAEWIAKYPELAPPPDEVA